MFNINKYKMSSFFLTIILFFIVIILVTLFNRYLYSNKSINKNINSNLYELYTIYDGEEVIGNVYDLDKFKRYLSDYFSDKLTSGNKILSLPETVHIVKRNEAFVEEDKVENYNYIIENINFMIDSVEITENDTGEKYIVPNIDVWDNAIDSIKKNIIDKDCALQLRSDTTVDLKKNYIKDVLSKKDIINHIMNPTNAKYIANENENLEKISHKIGCTDKELLLLNPQIEKNSIILDKTAINIPNIGYKNKFTFIKSIIVKEPILFQYQYTFDENRFTDDKEVIQKGENGMQSVQLDIKYTASGEEIILNKQVISVDKNPVTEIILQGNKTKPHVGTGKFIWPTHSHRTSAEYGPDYLFGKFRIHYGLDILEGINADIMAMDNGIVVTSAYNSGYGNYVIIDHNNGFYTLYAHLNKIKAHEGQVVSAGDVIGYMGATGIVTGTHLHLEIRVGGNSKYDAENPRKYIGY